MLFAQLTAECVCCCSYRQVYLSSNWKVCRLFRGWGSKDDCGCCCVIVARSSAASQVPSPICLPVKKRKRPVRKVWVKNSFGEILAGHRPIPAADASKWALALGLRDQGSFAAGRGRWWSASRRIEFPPPLNEHGDLLYSWGLGRTEGPVRYLAPEPAWPDADRTTGRVGSPHSPMRGEEKKSV